MDSSEQPTSDAPISNDPVPVPVPNTQASIQASSDAPSTAASVTGSPSGTALESKPSDTQVPRHPGCTPSGNLRILNSDIPFGQLAHETDGMRAAISQNSQKNVPGETSSLPGLMSHISVPGWLSNLSHRFFGPKQPSDSAPTRTWVRWPFKSKAKAGTGGPSQAYSIADSSVWYKELADWLASHKSTSEDEQVQGSQTTEGAGPTKRASSWRLASLLGGSPNPTFFKDSRKWYDPTRILWADRHINPDQPAYSRLSSWQRELLEAWYQRMTSKEDSPLAFVYRTQDNIESMSQADKTRFYGETVISKYKPSQVGIVPKAIKDATTRNLITAANRTNSKAWSRWASDTHIALLERTVREPVSKLLALLEKGEVIPNLISRVESCERKVSNGERLLERQAQHIKEVKQDAKEASKKLFGVLNTLGDYEAQFTAREASQEASRDDEAGPNDA